MGRWEPDAAGRLRQAALDLFVERGYEQTTVADIAGRAGVTERTFFRYFTDKREVLFAGANQLQDRIVAAITEAPEEQAPYDVVVDAMAAGGDVLEERREFARQRAAAIASHASLQERELLKLAALSAAAAQALRERGVAEAAAGLLAETGVALFRVAFERWVAAPGTPDLAACVREAAGELRAVAAEYPVHR
ncbi:TetR family transcriptional regulator [Nocardioides sp. CER19]|uniref:TetR family transcriptional regulator n=1 Tax=Nocardioides sp. CER19 TaxID=3038538 RepID=UPI002449E976|nr:TetR family transcriptional regulator [Nocardioides sp. CER19]MDH2413556.1 TetR family transcriptional regulator [Nocardioides sp. CER19]